jgi:hypothetical protein
MDNLSINRCYRCGEPVSDTAKNCPLCAAKIKIKIKPKSLIIKMAPLLLCLSLFGNLVQYIIADKRQNAEAARVADMSGARTFEEACKGCHNSKPLNNLRLTREQWKEAIERRANHRRPRVPEAEFPGLLDYLVAMTSGSP